MDDPARESDDSARDWAFAWERFEAMRAHFDDDAFLRTCRQRTKAIFPDIAEAAPAVAAEAETALAGGAPWSLVKIGDGEGLLLSTILPGWEGSWFLRVRQPGVRSTTGIEYVQAEFDQWRAMLLDAVYNADVLAVRSIDRGLVGSELENVEHDLKIGEIKGALGVMGGRAFLERELARGSFLKATLVSHWIYAGFIPYLERVARSAERLVVVSGIPELLREFERRVDPIPCVSIECPPEFFRPETRAQSHWGRFPEFLERVERASGPRTLVLTGAGIFGKFYCDAAKRRGAVAVDMGAGFEILAGRASRPVFEFFDAQSLKWL